MAEESTKSTMPIGAIIAYYGTTQQLEDDNWLVCDGENFDTQRYPKLHKHLVTLGYSGKNVPDLRGQFLRGGNLSLQRDESEKVNIDPDFHIRSGIDEKIGSKQEDQIRKHHHYVEIGNKITHTKRSGTDPMDLTAGDINNKITTEFGGSETRPTNIAVHWIIKAK